MPARSLPGLGLTGFWDYGANFKADMDANLRLLSAVVQLSVLSRASAVPTTGLADGQKYLLTSNPNINTVAVRDNGAWVYIAPQPGWRLFVENTVTHWFYTGTEWTQFAADGIPIDSLSGVSATTVQQALVVLSHHIDFLDTHLRAAATAAGYTVPPYVPPS